jgi:hypothetical protein
VLSDGALDEVSDLVASRENPGVLWAHEDSGGDPALYALDKSGHTIGTLTLTGVSNHDWEDLAVAPCPEGGGDCLWIGDTGDNGLSRDDVALYVVPEPVVSGPFTTSLPPVVYPFRYPAGRNNVEGVAIGPDLRPLLVTKRVDATAEVYRFPTLSAGTQVTVERLASLPTGDPADEHPAEATSADLNADGTVLLVRTYGSLLTYDVTDGTFGAPTALPAPVEGQGEAASFDPATGGVWLTSEGAGAPIWYVGCAS